MGRSRIDQCFKPALTKAVISRVMLGHPGQTQLWWQYAQNAQTDSIYFFTESAPRSWKMVQAEIVTASAYLFMVLVHFRYI